MRRKRATRDEKPDDALEALLGQHVPSEEAFDVDVSKLQRVIPRQPVDWNAKYRFQSDPPGHWRNCRFSDISTAGAGLRLFGITPEEANRHREIDVTIQLRGKIRNTLPGDDDVRVGIEFGQLAGDAASFVESLKNSDTRW